MVDDGDDAGELSPDERRQVRRIIEDHARRVWLRDKMKAWASWLAVMSGGLAALKLLWDQVLQNVAGGRH